MALPQRYIEHPEKELFTEDEYFEFSRTAEERWEFTPVGPPGPDGSRLGRIRMMAGGTDDHAAIIGNVARALGNALVPRGCRTYVSDMRVHTGSGKDTFPDVAVVCGPRQYHRGRNDTLINPVLIAEVLSESTAGYDVGDKFAHYQTIPTLADYLLVAQDAPRAILHSRAGDHWETRLVSGLGSAVHLPSVDVTLALADVYALIEFDEQEQREEI
ncbi:MAG: Uma2 family endonuclease [Armatimonadetes bacterium]|nr:Uma2 family endonuclease [Armatimonadota bacterium]